MAVKKSQRAILRKSLRLFTSGVWSKSLRVESSATTKVGLRWEAKQRNVSHGRTKRLVEASWYADICRGQTSSRC